MKQGSLDSSKKCYWYGHAMRREDGHVVRRASECEVECDGDGERISLRQKVRMFFDRDDILCRSKWIVVAK